MPISPNRPTQQQHSKGVYKPIKQPVLDLIVHSCETYQGIVFWYGCTHSVQNTLIFSFVLNQAILNGRNFIEEYHHLQHQISAPRKCMS